MVTLLIVVGLLVWAGSALLIDAWLRTRQPDFSERLLPYQPPSLGEEAERWLSGD